MTLIFWTDIRRFISWPLFLTIAGICLLTFSERQLTKDSYELFLLRMVSDQYYLLFFMLPLYLLSIYKNLEAGLPTVIVRFKTFSSYFFTRSFAILFNAGLFVSVHVLVICLFGIGLSSQNLYPVPENTSDILMTEYAKYFDTPLTGMFVAVLFMFAGLSFLGFLMQTLHHFLGKRVLIFLVMTSYILMLLVFKFPSLSNLSSVTINRFYIFHHNFHAPFAWVWTIGSMFVLGIIAVLLIKYYWNHLFRISLNVKPKGLFFYFSRMLWTPGNIGVSLIIILLFLILKTTNYPIETIDDIFLLFFYGQEIGHFHLMTFIEQLIYNGTPLYLIAIFTERVQRSSRLMLWMRIKSKFSWFKALLGNSLLFLTSYLLLTLLFIVLSGLANGQGWNGVTLLLNPASSENWIIKLIALKYMEFLMQYLGFLFLFLITRNATSSFLIVLSTHSLLLIPLDFLLYFPIGLGTIARIDFMKGSGGIPFVHAAVILTGSIIILYALCQASYKRFLFKEMG